jgi:dephospho-CoA kinase
VAFRPGKDHLKNGSNWFKLVLWDSEDRFALLTDLLYQGKPIIGIAGGIGSGKSFVAALLAEMGCHVIDSDAHVREAYKDPAVRKTLEEWWGPAVLLAEGKVDRALIAGKVFADPAQRLRLEKLIHPLVGQAREREMAAVARDPKVLAFVWDAPLLFEAGLDKACDAVIFVDAPLETRLLRVKETRGWGPQELGKREISQWPLDNKRELSDYTVTNAADAAAVRDQVRELLPLILSETAPRLNR